MLIYLVKIITTYSDYDKAYENYTTILFLFICYPFNNAKPDAIGVVRLFYLYIFTSTSNIIGKSFGLITQYLLVSLLVISILSFY
jgi:hypothetical protein